MTYHLKKQENPIMNRLPHIVVTSLFVISVWMLVRGFIKYSSLWLLQLGFPLIKIPILIGNPLNNPLLIEMIFSFIILIITWLLSTKVKAYQGIKMRVVVFFVMLGGISFQYLWATSIPIVKSFIPYLMLKQQMIYIENSALETAMFSNMSNLMLLFLSLPLIFYTLMLMWVAKFCNQHWGELVTHFKEWQYALRIPGFVGAFMDDEQKRESADKIKTFFDEKDPKLIPLPDVALGPNTKTGEMVYQKGKDRTLNNLIIGAIGTGKTSALILPIINQDLHHMTNMINNFKEYYANPEYDTEDVKGRLMNGISVIEPSKDLCDKAFALVKAHGIPDEAVFYIDPTNPNTPSINLFQGPTDKVAEMFTMVVSGIGESQEFFFEQSQRAHLKSHIYLLKEHEPNNDMGFEHLINMYNDAQLVHQMHIKLKERISSNIDEIEDRDERNQMLILKGISEWFDMTYVPVEKGFGKNVQPDVIKEGPYRGQQRVEDKKAEHVVGLRNILNDIAQNILLRRVLFGKSDFNFDKHLEYGGILLVNTAKGELSSLSDVLGKFCLLSLQAAVFRRKPNDSPFHHIIVDEFPDYLNEDFASFPAQSRKYKAIITVVAQTISQLQRKYGPDFMTTLVATLRNKFLYGDTTQLDADMFSAIFGEKVVYEESETDQEVSPMMDNPTRRTGQSYSKTDKARLTTSEIIYQDAFVAAVKLVEDNKPVPVKQVRANFVSKPEFKEAKVKVIKEAGDYWLQIRRENLSDNTKENQVKSIEDSESVLLDEDFQFQLPDSTVNHPLDEVNYEPSSSLTIDQSMFNQPPKVERATLQKEVTEESIVSLTEEIEPKEQSSSKELSAAESMVEWFTTGEEEVETPDIESDILIEPHDEEIIEINEPIHESVQPKISESKKGAGEFTTARNSNFEKIKSEEETIAFDDLFSGSFNKGIKSDEPEKVESPKKADTPKKAESPKKVETHKKATESPKKEEVRQAKSEDSKKGTPINPFKDLGIKPVELDDEPEEVTEHKKEKQEKPNREHKPVNPTVPSKSSTQPPIAQAKVFDDDLENYDKKMTEQMKRKQEEKEKKERQAKLLEEKRKQAEAERKHREEQRKQKEKEKSDKQSVNNNHDELIMDVPQVDITDENVEEAHQQHDNWKQKQIKEKRAKRKSTQLGDFGLFQDVMDALDKE